MVIKFRLARPLPLWNTIMRTHRFTRSSILKKLAHEVGWAIVEAGYRRPIVPFTNAVITIIRRSIGTPDPDGLSPKYILDVLQPESRRHPYGLGVIHEDTAKRLSGGAMIQHERVAHRAEQCTLVTIEGSHGE